MNEVEDKIKKIIDGLSKEELLELKKELMSRVEITYNENRKKEVLKKLSSKEEFLRNF